MANEVTTIKRCPQCAEKRIEHPYQDSLHGKYNRVFNLGTKGMVCTVCGYGKNKK